MKPTPTGAPGKASGSRTLADKQAAAGGARQRNGAKKPEPTLLNDFLRGRPSAARIAAQRRRRRSFEALQAELRQEMRQSSVRQLQPPSGVKARVNAWQRSTGSPQSQKDPDEAAVEPEDVAFSGHDGESVTEEDRIRIKMRQKRKGPNQGNLDLQQANADCDSPNKERIGGAPTQPLPRKRVVSDDNWRKANRAPTAARKVSPRTKQHSHQSPRSRDYKARPSLNTSVAEKVKEWAARSGNIEATHPSRKSASDLGDQDARTRRSFQVEPVGPHAQELKAKPQTPPLGRDDDEPGGLRPDVGACPVNWGSEEGDGDNGASECAEVREETKRGVPCGRENRKSLQNVPKESATRMPHSQQHVEATKVSSMPRITTTHRETRLEDLTSKCVNNDRRIHRPTARLEAVKMAAQQAKQEWQDVNCRTRSNSIEAASTVFRGKFETDERLNGASDVASSSAARSIADVPGEIPFGQSAFSELDLPSNKSRPRPTKVDRRSSLAAVPKVFKKVVEESKRLICEKNEPTNTPVANNSSNVEKWLNNTCDLSHGALTPAVLLSSLRSPHGGRRGPRPAADPMRTSSPPRKEATAADGSPVEKEAPQEVEEGPLKQPRSPSRHCLKRSRATRSPSSPLKHGGKRHLLGAFREAMQGESDVHPSSGPYESQEERSYNWRDSKESSIDDPLFQPNSDTSKYTVSDAGAHDARGNEEASLNASIPGPRLRPPTNGKYELSTILSEIDTCELVASTTSSLTPTSLTDATAMPADEQPADPQQSEGGTCGLTRRLTRHSDLVSVLSDPSDIIRRRTSRKRVRASVRRGAQCSEATSRTNLLQEFLEDERIYLRELKTMVDGVLPVLLSDFIRGKDCSELFGLSSSSPSFDSLSRSVVNMGIALEKLRNAHLKAPFSDIESLIAWAQAAISLYDAYLSDWRLGFEDVIVNLKPVAESLDDEDSLLTAMPRNQEGDIVDPSGERVNVAYLSKRPFARLKQMVRFFRRVDSITSSQDSGRLIEDLERLQEKAHRRHKEETARVIDENAYNTSTARARDLRSMEPAEGVVVDPTRQVNAKDVFSLDLVHSNGQRLECQVELVHRDNVVYPDDQGDLLIRETDDRSSPFLLFAPIPMPMLSARMGSSMRDLVVMVRGTFHGRAWFELLSLTADDEDQVLDWLDIFPSLPIPPDMPSSDALRSKSKPSTPTKGSSARHAEPRPWQPESPKSPIAKDLTQSSPPVERVSGPQDQRNSGVEVQRPCTLPRSQRQHSAIRFETEVKRERHPQDDRQTDTVAAPSMSPDGSPGTAASLHPHSHSPLDLGVGAARIPILKPGVDLQSGELAQRRSSSPLKHEYLPSDADVSSSSDYPVEVSDLDSSDDEIESLDIPETELGISLKSAPLRSQVTPSHLSSASSQESSRSAISVETVDQLATREPFAQGCTASISRWSDKGTWKDLSTTSCCILVTAGQIEAYPSQGELNSPHPTPLLALDLTPLVLIRQSTALDLEIRSSVQSHCQLHDLHGGGNFRFRCEDASACHSLYMMVHDARLRNEKFIRLENEARFKSFGQRVPDDVEAGRNPQGRRRSWFGRKNSYRGSVRAPVHDAEGASSSPSSTPSASSFLKRLTVAGSLPFSIARSSIDRRGTMFGMGNLYASGSSSAGGTPPRSPSVSVEHSGGNPATTPDNVRIRLHLLVAAAKWEDYGNCLLQIRRPPPGWRQALRADHGLEKRVTATTLPRREGDEPRVALDAVLGSGCFSPMGSRGIVCGVWEEVRDGDGVVGMVPATGATGGNIKKWCFQFANAADAGSVLRLVHQEVIRA